MKNIFIFLLIPFLSKSQDTLIVKSDILTENMIVYKDSIGITKIGEIEKKCLVLNKPYIF